MGADRFHILLLPLLLYSPSPGKRLYAPSGRVAFQSVSQTGEAPCLGQSRCPHWVLRNPCGELTFHFAKELHRRACCVWCVCVCCCVCCVSATNVLTLVAISLRIDSQRPWK